MNPITQDKSWYDQAIPHESTRTHYEVERRAVNGVWINCGNRFSESDLEELERSLESEEFPYKLIKVTTITERQVVRGTSQKDSGFDAP